MRPSTDRVVLIETIGVGIFGAFVGGEFVAAMLRQGPAAGLSGTAVVAALVCCVVALVLLIVMRRAVGPLRSGKQNRRS